MLNQYLDETKIEVGLDEAGRGCLFGPVCVGAVVWPKQDPLFNGEDPPIIKDSKKVSEKKRNILREYIEENMKDKTIYLAKKEDQPVFFPDLPELIDETSAEDKLEDIKKIQVSESINMMGGASNVKTVTIDPNYVVSNA